MEDKQDRLEKEFAGINNFNGNPKEDSYKQEEETNEDSE